MGPRITSGAAPGSISIGGVGQPNRLPDCIVVCENGANNVFEDCGPNPLYPNSDDVVLGASPGADTNGNFTVPLTAPLESGAVVCVYDTCDATAPEDFGRGNCLLVIDPAPAPALSPAAAAMAVAMLGLIGLSGLVRLPFKSSD